MGGKSKAPYNDRSDLEKLQSQWNKINGIMAREREWSAAIVRAATAAEIAANVAVRQTFSLRSSFSEDFIDSLLVWANGMDGKLKRLLIPSASDQNHLKALKAICRDVERLNQKRNSIVHRGEFAAETEAREFIALARNIIEGLVKPYEPTFVLTDKEPKKRTKAR